MAHPTDQLNIVVGGPATFTVIASGAVVYEWRKDGVAINNSVRITGADTAMLSISSIATGDEGNYNVFIMNDAGDATSTVAMLSIRESVQCGIIVLLEYFAGEKPLQMSQISRKVYTCDLTIAFKDRVYL